MTDGQTDGQTDARGIRAVAGQCSSPALCFATKSIKSMTKDIDLNVTQVGRDTSDQYLPTC